MRRFYVAVTNNYGEQEVIENHLSLKEALGLAEKVEYSLSDDFIDFNVDVLIDRRNEYKDKIEPHAPFSMNINRQE